MNNCKFEIRYDTCKFCGLVYLGEKEGLLKHLQSDKVCQVIQKKREEEYKKEFDRWQSNVDRLNEVIRLIQNDTLDEKNIKIDINNLIFCDDGKEYKDDEDHKMIVIMYTVKYPKFSSYRKEWEIFRRFDRAKIKFAFELRKIKLIGIERSKLSDIPYKMKPKEEKRLWREFTETTLTLIEEQVEEEFKLKKEKLEKEEPN